MILTFYQLSLYRFDDIFCVFGYFYKNDLYILQMDKKSKEKFRRSVNKKYNEYLSLNEADEFIQMAESSCNFVEGTISFSL